MFDKINRALEIRSRFEFSSERCFSVADFLARFDAIFGLNQDLLLELYYEDQVLHTSSRRWDGVQKPGMNQDPDSRKRRWTPAQPVTVAPRLQPYFKMHGSSNWYTNDCQNLLVMGGNKDLIIRQSDLLRSYYEQFKNYLSRPQTRLMVIGYRFADRHVNDAIIEAWRSGTLKGMFLVDPDGLAVLHDDLKCIDNLGRSTRLMSATFAGDDPFEHQRLIDFFQPIQ
jgi:hypothetical protein